MCAYHFPKSQKENKPLKLYNLLYLCHDVTRLVALVPFDSKDKAFDWK